MQEVEEIKEVIWTFNEKQPFTWSNIRCNTAQFLIDFFSVKKLDTSFLMPLKEVLENFIWLEIEAGTLHTSFDVILRRPSDEGGLGFIDMDLVF